MHRLGGGGGGGCGSFSVSVMGFRVETPLGRRPRNLVMLLYGNGKMADENVSRDEIWRDLAGV